MDALRKSIGAVIIIFIGIPSLLGIIWAVGMTRAVVSSEFLTDLPREIIERVPDMVEDVLEEIDREDLLDNPNEQAWVRAVNRADISPKQLMDKIGLRDWLENELSVTLEKVAQMLRGDLPPREVTLNMRPLKTALRHEGLKDYLVEILKQLPECDENQMEEWREAAMSRPRDLKDLPACRPLDMESAALAVNFVRDSEVDDIPDEVKIFEDVHRFPRGIDFFSSIMGFTYLLFLVPAGFILVASLIGGTGRGGFFRWSGVSTLIGGILAYALSSLLKSAIPWGLGFAYESYHVTDFENLMIGKGHELTVVIMDQLLKGVNSVAGVVCVVGIVLFACSFLIAGSGNGGGSQPRQGGGQQQPQPQQPPQQPPHPYSSNQQQPQAGGSPVQNQTPPPVQPGDGKEPAQGQ